MNRQVSASLLAGLLFLAQAARAQQQGCPAGTVQVGVQDEHPSPNVVIHHPVCEETGTQSQGRTYTPSGNAMIGGTLWITGYNVQNADPRIIAKAHEMMDQQMKLAGLRYADGVDFGKYNFVLGIAASTDVYQDLSSRVVFDEYSNGQFSAREQAGYASLKGRQFDELGCHSNGAMICLAALENRDIKVDHVALYGPQITVESLQMWDQLVRSGQVKSVEININTNDPVPPFSLAIGGGAVNATVIASLALFKTPTLADVIEETSPRLTVRTHACGNGFPDLDCHDMAVYKANSGNR
jgi:hypothetical protein